jgi:hypothetical protein
LRKYARREGDFALAGIPLFYDEDRQGALSNAHLGVIGACPPASTGQVETPLNGHAIDDGLIRQAAEEVDPSDDFYAGVSSRTAILLAATADRTSRLGIDSRKARTGIRLCPPAMTDASGFDASGAIASRRVPGAW